LLFKKYTSGVLTSIYLLGIVTSLTQQTVRREMSTVTPINVTRIGDTIFDRELDALDEAQYQAERRVELIHARVNELQIKRMADLSFDDLELSLEALTTPSFRNCLMAIREGLITRDVTFVPMLLGMIEGLLVRSSFDQARAEINALDALKSGDRH